MKTRYNAERKLRIQRIKPQQGVSPRFPSYPTKTPQPFSFCFTQISKPSYHRAGRYSSLMVSKYSFPSSPRIPRRHLNLHFQLFEKAVPYAGWAYVETALKNSRCNLFSFTYHLLLLSFSLSPQIDLGSCFLGPDTRLVVT